MSLRPSPIPTVPTKTARIARAAFPKGNVYLTLRDEVGGVYDDADFAHLFPKEGQPATSPWRLALVMVMQYAENLTDRQAADAVRSRIDWKYALSLELDDAGFDFSVLSEFRQRLIRGGAEALLLEKLLDHCKTRGLVRGRGQQRTDATHVLAAVVRLNRLELIGQTLQHALEHVARIAPDWLKARVPPRWYERYAKKLDEYRLPDRDTEREAMAADIGQDGQTLLTWVGQPDTPEAVVKLPAIAVLRGVWHEQFIEQAGHLRWRTVSELPRPGNAIASPHDPQARFRVKREVAWLGYQVHLTETCDDDLPHLIVQVETTVAAQTEFDALPAIHHQLAQHDLLPAHHLVDAGYASGQTLLDSQRAYQVDLVCPVPVDHSWQARTAGAFDLTHFRIDWQHQHATCPMGNVSLPWRQVAPTKAPHQLVFFTRFRKADCAACPVRARCTRGQGPRSLTLLPQAEFLALQHARQRQQTEAFTQQYTKRAGIEGTLSQAVSRAGLRRSRYIGLAKTHLQHLLTAAALNIVRLVNWFNAVPRAQTRVSHFAALAA